MEEDPSAKASSTKSKKNGCKTRRMPGDRKEEGIHTTAMDRDGEHACFMGRHFTVAIGERNTEEKSQQKAKKRGRGNWRAWGGEGKMLRNKPVSRAETEKEAKCKTKTSLS